MLAGLFQQEALFFSSRLSDHNKTVHVESKPARKPNMVPVISTREELATDSEKT